MAKEYLAAKHPGGRRIHILDEVVCEPEDFPGSDIAGITKNGFVIHNDGVVYNDELGIYE